MKRTRHNPKASYKNHGAKLRQHKKLITEASLYVKKKKKNLCSDLSYCVDELLVMGDVQMIKDFIQEMMQAMEKTNLGLMN